MMWFGYGSWWMGLSMVLFWGGLIVLVVWLVRPSDGRSVRSASRARDILDERFARGEIDSTEYQERLAALERTDHA